MKKFTAVVLTVIMLLACTSAISVSAADGLEVTKTLTPNADGSVTVTINLTGHAQKVALDGVAKADVMLLLDLSSSMVNEKIDNSDTCRMDILKPAACSLVDSLVGVENSQSLVGVIGFWSECALVSGLTNDAQALKTQINALEAKSGTAMAGALAAAKKTLAETGRADAPDVIVLVTDGSPYEIGADGVRIEDRAQNFAIVSAAANDCKAAGDIIYTVGIGLNDETNTFLQGCATDATKAYSSATGSDLGNIFADLSGAISVSSSATNVMVGDYLSEGVSIPSNAVVTSSSQYRPAETLAATTGSNGISLQNIGQVPYAPSVENTEVITITYVVQNTGNITDALIGTNDSFVAFSGADGAQQSISLASSYSYVPTANPPTGIESVIPAMAIAAVSAGAIVLMRKKRK